MAQLTSKGEVANFTDFDQFISGQSLDQCGPAAVSMFWHSTKPGTPEPWTPAQCQAMMASDYVHFIGPDVPGDQAGTDLEQLYKMLAYHTFRYQAIPLDDGIIRAYLNFGCPVIIAVTEASVFDEELGARPYNWDPTGLNHIIVASGPAQPGTLLCRDTASIAPEGVRPGPRRYDTSKLVLISATVVIPTWITNF